MTTFDSLTLFASGRLILLRWFYLLSILGFLGFFSSGQFEQIKEFNFVFTPDIVFLGVLLSAIVFNLFLFVGYRFIYNRQSNSLLSLLNGVQIILDIFICSIGLLFFSHISILLPLVFLYPLIEAVVLFSPAIAFFISLLTSTILYALDVIVKEGLNFLGFELNTNLLTPVTELGSGGSFLSPGLIWALVIIVFGFIFSYLHALALPKESQRINSEKIKRFRKLQDEKDEKDKWMRKFSAKIDENGRQLRAKELELALARQKLDVLEHAKSEFISVTTHQLRTPMSAIKWTFNMMLSEQLGPINEDQKDFLNKGYQSTLRVMNIVNNLVHIDHDEAKKDDYNFTATDIVALLKEISFEFSNQAESQNITLSIKDTPNNLPAINLDVNKIRMVFENLLDNALKYTPRNGKIEVEIKDDRLNTAEQALEVVVKDNGVGIPKTEQAKIFHK
ncbi:MAG: HAMP domain-containing sensor histidine kinase, partial [Candidatus Paceibacterota bacterium]